MSKIKYSHFIEAEKRKLNYLTLEENIGYKFDDKKLLEQVLTRRSAINSRVIAYNREDNQRLEFLGDKVLGLAIGELLYSRHPNWNEEKLTSQTSYHVRNDTMLPRVAKDLNLGDYLIMDKGEEINNRGRNNPKILADSLEALLGAIYLDSGRNINIIKALVIKHWYNLDLGLKYNHPHRDKEINFQVVAFKCIQASDTKMLKAMLMIGLNPDTTNNHTYIRQNDMGNNNKSDNSCIYIGDTLLTSAIRMRDNKTIKLLLESGADANKPARCEEFDFSPDYPLHLLVAYNLNRLQLHERTAYNSRSSISYKECIKLMVLFGADATQRDIMGDTALINAVIGQNVEAFNAIMKATHIFIATEEYNVGGKFLSVLNTSNDNGRNVLHVAAASGNSHDPLSGLFVSQRFIDKLIGYGGMKVNVRDDKGRTPLHYAAMGIGDRTEIINYLIAKGANAHLTDKNLSQKIHAIRREELMHKYGNDDERREASSRLENSEKCRLM